MNFRWFWIFNLELVRISGMLKMRMPNLRHLSFEFKGFSKLLVMAPKKMFQRDLVSFNCRFEIMWVPWRQNFSCTELHLRMASLDDCLWLMNVELDMTAKERKKPFAKVDFVLHLSARKNTVSYSNQILFCATYSNQNLTQIIPNNQQWNYNSLLWLPRAMYPTSQVLDVKHQLQKETKVTLALGNFQTIISSSMKRRNNHLYALVTFVPT